MNTDVLFQLGTDKPSGRQKFIISVIFILLALFFIIFTFIPSWMKLNTDFANSYVASRLVLDGVSTEHIYNMPWFQRQMDYYGVKNQPGQYNFPPFSALVMTPIALFKLEPLQAKHVWLLLNLLFMFLSIALIRKFTGKGLIPIAIFFILSGTVLRNNFLFGQVYMLLLLSVIATLYFYQKGNDNLAGLILAFGIVTREFPVFVLFYFLWKKQWKIATYTFAWIFAFTILSVSVMGVKTHLVYIRELHPQLSDGWNCDPYSTFYQTINSLLHNLFVYEPSLNPNPLFEMPFLYPIFKILFCIPIFLSTLSTINCHLDYRSSTRTMMEFCIFLTFALLLSPISSSYTWLLWILPMAVFANTVYRKKKYGILIFLLLLYLATGSNIVNITTSLREGCTVFMAYPRFWITLIGFITMLFIYKKLYQYRKHAKPERIAACSIVGLILIFTLTGNIHYFSSKTDEAAPLKSEQSLLITSPTVSKDRLIYSTLQMKGYVLMDENGPLQLQFDGDAFTPKLSTEGNLVAFEGVKDRHSCIYLYKDGQSPIAITDPTLNAQYPAFRGNPPEADEIAFVSNCKGNSDIYLTQLRTPNSELPTPICLIATSAEEIEPSFSPDGNKLVYASNLTGSYKLYIMNLIDRSTKQITFGSSTERQPCWSPDGKYIAFSSNRSGNWDIWIYDVQTTSLRQVSKERRSDTNPCWMTDLTHIIFTSDRRRGAGFTALYKIKAF
ncbi:MAG TPA: glycosyltransferase 87 family protein [Candidatus Brocadiia bacterium]|nr:glycosyltransferase 87 family protein [Candidatus Brocadiales bacterium]